MKKPLETRSRPGAALRIVGGLLLAVFSLGACTTSPATGKLVPSFNSRLEEKRIGKREHAKIVKQFGGVYKDPKVTNYVRALGNRLAAASELPDIGWTFTVLNSDQINAFAIPGGFTYVTRGLMALAENEAELAGVMAHEIGHVTALHSSARQAGGFYAGLGSIAAGLFLGRAGAEAGNYLSQGLLQRYSRDQEFEADSLGVRYLSRTGYNTQAMASFLVKMRANTQLQNKILGRPENQVDQYSFFASHPRTTDRVKRAIREASITQSGSRFGKVDYMKIMEGMIYGDDPDQGVIRGRKFIHPALWFSFSVPEEFRLINNPRSVVASGPEGATIQFDMDFRPHKGSMANYLRNLWAAKARVSSVERITVNGMDGATGATQVRRRDGIFDLRFVAIRQNSQRIFRMLFFTPQRLAKQLSKGLQRTTFSLRTISAREAAAIKPWRIKITPVRAGDTVAGFTRQMAVNNFKEETFRVLNGLGPNDRLRTGELVKIVTDLPHAVSGLRQLIPPPPEEGRRLEAPVR